jgi:hypothetical protein
MQARSLTRSARRLSWLVVLGLVSASLFLPSTAPALGAQDTITICHATGSDSNPYVTNNPSKDGDVSGHADHTGPIWFDGIDEDWGDIIPPFEFPGGSFPGLNWPEGQAILNNNCNIPDPTPTPTPTPSPTPTPTPSPTPTPTPEGATPTPTPAGGVGPATGTPDSANATPTLPSTSTIDQTGSGPTGDGWRIILLAMAGVLAAALLLTPASVVVRKDDGSR